MAIPKDKLDQILMNAFIRVFKIGGLCKATQTVWEDSDWRPDKIVKKGEYYILLSGKPSYSYEAYCKMCWSGKDEFIPLHFHATLLDGNKYKEVFVSIYCGLPKTTSEILMFNKICARLKDSGPFDSIEDKDNNGI